MKQSENEKVEFKAKVTSDIGEEICALANSQGGHLLIGISDKGEPIGCDPKKTKETISQYLTGIVPPVRMKFDIVKVDQKKILVLEVAQSRYLCSIGGMVYIRTGTSKRPLSIQEVFHLASENLLFEADRCPSGNKEIDRKAFSRFMSMARVKISDPDKYLERTRVWSKKKDLTIAGLLMFGKHPQETMPHTAVRIFFNNDSWKRFTGNLMTMIDDIEEELRTRLSFVSRRYKFKRIDQLEYPMAAIREGVVNALVHRNLAVKSEVFIELTGNELVIKNPGSFPPGTTPEDPHPVPRNPLLYELMFQAGYVERQGRGIDLIRDAFQKNPLTDFQYILSPSFTTLRFYKKTQELPKEMQTILFSLDEGEMSASEIATKIVSSKVTALRKINRLIEMGYVEKLGSGPYTRYRLRVNSRR